MAAPAPHHRPGDQARDAEGGQHVGAEHRLAVLIGHFQERRVLQDPGVVDEDVDLARGAGQLLGEARVVQVARERLHWSLFLQRGELGFAASGGEHFRARLRERQRRGSADARACAGDQHLLAGESGSHLADYTCLR